MDDAEFLRKKLKELTEVLDARTGLLMKALTTINEIGDEHFIAERFLLENKTGIEQLGCTAPIIKENI